MIVTGFQSFIYYYCVHVVGYTYAMMHMERSEDNCQFRFLEIRLVVRLLREVLLPIEPSHQTQRKHLKICVS